MIMKTKILICFGALLGIAAVGVRKQLELPKVAVTAQVVDEQGAPIAGAMVKFVFGEAHNANAIVRVEGMTDGEGKFTGEGYSDGSFGATIVKDGYYRSGITVPELTDIVNGKSQAVLGRSILRHIGKPVALYAKRVKTEAPVLDQACGYDLEKGDWVSPWGTGEKSDLTFLVHRDYKDWFNFAVEAEMTFAQPHDGLLRMQSPSYAHNSVFHWERTAPEIGYLAPHHIRFINHDPRSNQPPEKTFDTTKEREIGYFLRVRTLEENGRIISANYGKITGDIAIDPRDAKTCTISFTYYLNPTPLDRNLEWDTTKNLFRSLKQEETPNEP
jgi:hypothetical protein